MNTIFLISIEHTMTDKRNIFVDHFYLCFFCLMGLRLCHIFSHWDRFLCVLNLFSNLLPLYFCRREIDVICHRISIQSHSILQSSEQNKSFTLLPLDDNRSPTWIKQKNASLYFVQRKNMCTLTNIKEVKSRSFRQVVVACSSRQ